MPLAIDLLHPTPSDQKRKCKLKRLVQSPNSCFMDVKCPSCYTVKIIFSRIQNAVKCEKCTKILCTSTGGKTKVSNGCSFRYRPR